LSTREWAPRRTQINSHSSGQELALQVRCRVRTLPTLAFLKRTQKWLLVRLAGGRGGRVAAGGSLLEGSQRPLGELIDPTPDLAGGDSGGATAGVPPSESAKGHDATARGTRRAMTVNLPPHLRLRHLHRIRDLLHVCRVDLSPFTMQHTTFPIGRPPARLDHRHGLLTKCVGRFSARRGKRGATGGICQRRLRTCMNSPTSGISQRRLWHVQTARPSVQPQG
jgi:hypothetical protein